MSSRRSKSAAPAAVLAAETPAQIADRAKAWDEARTQLNTVATAAAAAQVALDGLPSDASDDDRHAALLLLAEAEKAVRDAEARIRELSSLEGAAPSDGAAAPVSSSAAGVVANSAAPADIPTGAASATAHGGNASARPEQKASEPGSAGDAVRSPATNTRDGVTEGEAGLEAGLATPAVLSREAVRDTLMQRGIEEADELVARAMALAAAGDLDAALAQLAWELLNCELGVEICQMVGRRLKQAELELRRSKQVWPLENVMYGGELHAGGGEPFQMDPDDFDRLQHTGAVSDTDPNQVELASDAEQQG